MTYAEASVSIAPTSSIELSFPLKSWHSQAALGMLLMIFVSGTLLEAAGYLTICGGATVAQVLQIITAVSCGGTTGAMDLSCPVVREGP